MNINRMRGRSQRAGNGGGGTRQSGGGVPSNRNYVFDSKGPEMRLRGTAQQLFEKYLQLGRDATGGGDRVMAESCFQHAEHYFRIVNAMSQAQQSQMPPQGSQSEREAVGFGGRPETASPETARKDDDALDVPIGASPADGLSL